MEDASIIDLYWLRSERAIEETDKKYGRYCHSIAYNILSVLEDAEECVSDTYLRAWNAMPPHRPDILSAFLGKITRRLALNKFRDARSAKRGGGESALALDELAECIPSGGNVESELDRRELERAINRFLSGLSQTQRDIFVLRYWFVVPVSLIAEKFSFSQSKVKSLLYRLRAGLRSQLEKEGLL